MQIHEKLDHNRYKELDIRCGIQIQMAKTAAKNYSELKSRFGYTGKKFQTL